jgi:hypothetical protein
MPLLGLGSSGVCAIRTPPTDELQLSNPACSWWIAMFSSQIQQSRHTNSNSRSVGTSKKDNLPAEAQRGVGGDEGCSALQLPMVSSAEISPSTEYRKDWYKQS